MSKEEQQNHIESIHRDISGLQNVARSQSQEISQALGMLGTVNQDLDNERQKVQRLQKQVEELYNYVNKQNQPVSGY